MKIRANDIDLIDAERFDGFSSVIFNCKIKYCCFNKKLNNIRLTLKTSVKFVFAYCFKFLLCFTYITSQFSYFSLPCNHTNLTEVFSVSLILFSFLLKQQYLILQLKMTLEKLSKRFASTNLISLALIFMLKVIETAQQSTL